MCVVSLSVPFLTPTNTHLLYTKMKQMHRERNTLCSLYTLVNIDCVNPNFGYFLQIAYNWALKQTYISLCNANTLQCALSGYNIQKMRGIRLQKNRQNKSLADGNVSGTARLFSEVHEGSTLSIGTIR